ncbi:GuaB3 family IMP dehydrogenase-related protein [Tessaracoccus sp. MC1865]|uniref:GuaB3 family IMP dehydrogenase-related protein n=1 Tax=Tessaracoccus sp. MC1865 TaxID=2760310 RepID=UPI0016037570|nr:GuaB3 family IMP dehydrogenase-related protein [Tessaracoccus sp. MC1865]MBB1484614.1 GuaB3 family IMP dehydrogenase-related protein [Tessaracoccus sp. MC1865]QTO38297.1 GuaB3 family IMP dehydrogenase-related protein [Tessaracoccus sp. MC1865]
MYELERSKRASRAYSFDDVAIAPTRRTRSDEEVDLSWKIDAVSFDVPIVAAPMDSVMSPAAAIRMGQLGGLGVLNLEGLWTRYEDPQAQYELITQQSDQVTATKRLQEIYAEPVKAELIRDRLAEIRDAGVPVAGSLSPARTQEFAPIIEKAGMDFFVIRGTTVSAEHVGGEDTLNLKDFIYRFDTPVLVGGVATYRAGLHLMRSGAAGVLVGFGGGATHTTASVLGIQVPMASAVADVAEARRDYLEESGGRYVHIIADGAVGRSGDIAKAIACGADAVMVGSPLARATEAPGRGWHWGSEAWHASLPRGERSFFEQVGTLEEVVLGPSRVPDGTMNLAGGLRKAMALTGYTDLKSFQRIELILL